MIIKHKSKKTGSVYIVDTLKLTCSCPQFEYRCKKFGTLCKHIDEELNNLSNKQTQAMEFIRTNDSAVEFVEAFSEEVLTQLKQAGHIWEVKGKLIQLK